MQKWEFGRWIMGRGRNGMAFSLGSSVLGRGFFLSLDEHHATHFKVPSPSGALGSLHDPFIPHPTAGRAVCVCARD